MHSGTGEGMHADGEYVVWQSVEELARIQIEYLKKSGECLSGRKYRAAARAGNGGKTGVSPFAADGGGSCGRKSPAFPAKGWHLPGVI